jgi:hypothetical protein
LQVLHGKVCDECNQALGREIDQEFTRVGPEAILRSGLGIEGRHGSSQSPFYFRAATTQPLRAIDTNAPDDETGLLWETVPGSSRDPEARLLQQLVVIDHSGNRHVVPLNIEWPAATLRHALEHRGIDDGTLQEIYLDPEDVERVRPTLSEVFPNFSAQHFAISGGERQRRTLLLENSVGPAYLRAIAKIGFHGALRLRPELAGDEREFDVIRRFIRRGDLPRVNAVQYRRERAIAGIGNGVMLGSWGHVIAVETTYTEVYTRLQFFIGPGAIPPMWIVRIGRRPDSIQNDTGIAYFARYLETPSEDGHTGELVALEAAPRVNGF